MKNIWAYISAFLAGTIAGVMLMVQKIKPVINTQSYIEQNEQKVGKLKQRGENNEQTTKGEIAVSAGSGSEAIPNKKEARKERREKRKFNRKNKRQ